MEGFSIKGESGNYLAISIQEVYGFPESTCHWGGYELYALLEIKSGNFLFKSRFSTSTGEIYEFFKKMEVCDREMQGAATFLNFERSLEFTITYSEMGQVDVKGKYCEYTEFDNELKFGFTTDQSYLTHTVEELNQIVLKYGDMKGMKGMKKIT